MEIIIGFGWLSFALIAAAIGSRKGEGFVAFILGVLLGPLGILAAMISRGNRTPCRDPQPTGHPDWNRSRYEMTSDYERLLAKVKEYREQIERLERRGASEFELSTPRSNYKSHKEALDHTAEQLHAFKHTLPPVYLNGTKPERNGRYGSIYLIYNEIEHSGYVGMTDYAVEDRLLRHAFLCGGGKLIGKAFERLPKESFYLFVLEQCADLGALGERERYWIQFLGTYRHGYNGNAGSRVRFKSRLARAEHRYEDFKSRADGKLNQYYDLPRNAPSYRRDTILNEHRSWKKAADEEEAEIRMLKALADERE